MIFVINSGSSSVKYALYTWDNQQLISNGLVERIGMEGGPPSHKEALESVIYNLTQSDNKVIDNIHQIRAVGHRVVHGGDKFNKSVHITPEVLDTIKEVAHLAPLHNPPNIMGIESSMEILPNVAQVAVFDTAFHQTLPESAYIYPVPYEWYQNFGVRKYGFHGSSHLYVTKRAAKFLNKPKDAVNLITMHIGNGVSFTAIENGVSVDTSMGLTPLEGAMMGTRCGDIDPAIVSFMSEKLGISCQDVVNILNKKSGHLGVTGKYTDRRDIEKAMYYDADERCKLSLDIEARRIKKYIGSYMALLYNVDAIVFTAGVGENNPYIREKATDSLSNLGIYIDKDKNRSVNSSSGEVDISTSDSPVKILVIPTNEEAVLVEDVIAILENRYDFHMNYTYKFE